MNTVEFEAREFMGVGERSGSMVVTTIEMGDDGSGVRGYIRTNVPVTHIVLINRMHVLRRARLVPIKGDWRDWVWMVREWTGESLRHYSLEEEERKDEYPSWQEFAEDMEGYGDDGLRDVERYWRAEDRRGLMDEFSGSERSEEGEGPGLSPLRVNGSLDDEELFLSPLISGAASPLPVEPSGPWMGGESPLWGEGSPQWSEEEKDDYQVGYHRWNPVGGTLSGDEAYNSE